ncbi:MAG: biotin/lipoyl-binding protein [Deltaproteobacteria bacterium]|nr:MAG: biotin/lipoyl-binding protein [Deltaproteobacteria bacterium]
MAEKIIVKTGSGTYEVEVRSFDGNRAELVVDGKSFEVTAAPKKTGAVKQQTTAPTSRSQSGADIPLQAAQAGSGKQLAAQMPGTVLKVLVETGREVKAGQVLLVLEAMKMENEIRSDRNGRVAKVLVEAGQQVQTGQGLIEFE